MLIRTRTGAYTSLFSEPLLEELVDVLSRPWIREQYHLTAADVAIVLALIRLRGQAVFPNRRIAVRRDPGDVRALEAAVAEGADAVVTGDGDPLAPSPFGACRS